MNGPTNRKQRETATGASGRGRTAGKVALVVIGLSLCSVRALAEPGARRQPGSGAARHLNRLKTDGKVQMLRQAHRSGTSLSRLGRRAASMVKETGEINVTVTFDHELSEMEIDFYEDAGVRFMRIGGQTPANAGRFYPAWVTDGALLALNEDPSVVYVSAGGPMDGLRTMDQSIPEIQADIRHRTPVGLNAFGNQGAGVVIANFDPGIDVHHPDFFRPRSGLTYDWLDADASGTFSAFFDCVDLNRNGGCDADERLGLETFPNTGGVTFDPKTDWLYRDANGNGRRDHGPADGFNESDPSYGETIFIAHDANDNHVLDFGEKLTPLGESKVRAMITADGSGNPVEYHRGQNLIDTPIDPDGHGTSVASILVAQDYGYDRSFVGVAPDAELLVVDRAASGNQIFNMQWAKANGADIILWEFGAWTQQFLDGSSPVEQAISADMESGECFHVTPNGNLAASNRHAEVEFTGTSASQTLTFSVPADKSLGNIRLSVLWQGADDDVSFEIKNAQSPAYTPIQVPGLPTLSGPGGALYRIHPNVLSVSPRGTARYDGVLQREGGSLDAETSFNLRVTAHNGFSGKVHLYVADNVTAWSGGVYWNTAATPASTLTYPATADSAFNVGSYSVSSQPGQLSDFSGRGPRIDGAASLLDIAAPGHHDITCATSSFGFLWAAGTPIFGGTSAAGPHAAGAAALLMSAVPAATPPEVAQAMTTAAFTDANTGAGYSQSWGHGKLRVDDAYRYLAQQQCPAITLSQMSPPDGATGLDTASVAYSWLDHPAADRYDLYVGTRNPPTTLISNLVVSSLSAGTLQPNTTYYWQLFGRNACGYTTSSPVMHFTTAGADEPEINVTAAGAPLAINDTVAFDPTEVGAIGERTLVIHNSGSAPLTLTGFPNILDLSGGDGAFSVVGNFQPPVAPLDARNIVVRFAPEASGPHEALLSIPNDDADENPFTIRFSGTATAEPVMLVTAVGVNGPTPIDAQLGTTVSFADADITETTERVFHIANDGNGPLLLEGDPTVQLGGENADDFSVIAQPESDTIAPLAGAAFRLAFTPTLAGTRTATVTIASNDPLQPALTFAITGFGVEEPAITDCNGNGRDDLLDVALGESEDCNVNLRPDECEPDADDDGVTDECDQCPSDNDRTDSDGDGAADCLDNCPLVANADQSDGDGDGVGDACQNSDTIVDCNGNGRADHADIAAGDSGDCDADGTPDECEADGDGDGMIDACDVCPGADDLKDADTDHWPDCLDNCPLVANADQADGDGDGVGDACEPANVPGGPQFCGAGVAAFLPILTLGLLGFRSSRTHLRPNQAPRE